MAHVIYRVNLVGVDHVALGPDTVFGDHVGLHHAFATHLSLDRAHGDQPFTEVPCVKGMENPGEAVLNAVKWVKRGFSPTEIGKLIGGNIIRVLRETSWN